MAESVEVDYETAAEAWMVLEFTMEMMRHRNKCISIASEYERRLREEENRGS